MSKKPKREPTALEQALSTLRIWALIGRGRAEQGKFDQGTLEKLAQSWELVQQIYAMQ